MALTLALLEGSTLFAAVCASIFLWARPLLLDWLDLAAILGQAAALSVCCTVAFYYNDLYDLRIVRSFGAYAARLLQAFGVAFMLLGAFYSLFPATQIAEGPFVSSLLVVLGLLLPLRALSYALMRSRPFTERVLILGATPLTHQLIDEIEAQPHIGYAVVGVVDDATPAGEPALRYPLLGPLGQLGKILDELHPDRIVVALAERRGRLPLGPLLEARMRGATVEDGVGVHERLSGKLAIETLTPGTLIFSRDFRKSRFDLAAGRALSVLVSGLGLLIASPLMALIALSIKLDSRGPVFFLHERVGLNMKRFQLIKFRTMHPSATETSEWVWDNSDRITRVGHWLRKFRLDELPQFVNILRGDMNLVGPRPHPVSNLALFGERIPYYSLRAMVRPGVTGWAQIRYGYANNLEEEIEKMRYDLYYIKHLSPWFDARILFDTVKIVLFGRGSRAADAYPVDTALGASGPPPPGRSSR